MKNSILRMILILGFANTYGQKVDSLVIDKSGRKLFLYSERQVIRKYEISLGDNPKGPKTAEGD